MTEFPFGSIYADQYDLLYGDKNYGAECDLLETLFGRYGQGPIESILDLGCGTGGHAIPLAQRGYRVTGVDRSASMLAHAREKAFTLTSPLGIQHLNFIQDDVLTLSLDQRFDAVVMMFAVLGYQLSNQAVADALRTVRRHLKPGGVFICDVWYGPAVLSIRPSERVKVFPTAEGELVRAAWGKLDSYRHLCEVGYRLWRISGDRVVDKTEESHWMRYFFPQELALYLECAELDLVQIRAFENLEKEASEETWNVLVVAKAS